eukprot:TRINITY_DN4616_c0_g2_i1.p1 TRINITY_DN4616_c0_g2~~TRINITY_DN4616_c0_g2_i1.p1  ORF type:complete len:992 (+),score=321.98 TRINITY_DN4616_c0_g2_i1:70-3045(+)
MDISTRTPREVLDMIQHADPSGRELMGVVYSCKQRVDADSDFAEGLVEAGGLLNLLELMPKAGAAMGYVLDTVCGLLLYLNGLQQLLEQPDIVDRVWKIVTQKDSQGDVAIKIARPAVLILIITVKFLDQLQNTEDAAWITSQNSEGALIKTKIDAGRRAVHKAVKRLVEKEGIDCYATLAILLGTTEIQLLTNVMGLLNILLQKTKEESAYKAKKLLFRWQQCGLLQKADALTSEDVTLRRLLETFKKTRSTLKIPECWGSALKYMKVFDREKTTYDSINKEVFIFQQQQNKIRDARLGMQKFQETLYAASIQLGISPLYHPTKRFADGGGMNIPTAPIPPSTRPVQMSNALDKMMLVDVRSKLFEGFKAAQDFRSNVEHIVGPVATPAAERAPRPPGMNLDDDDSDDSMDSDGIGPPDDDDDDDSDDSIEPPTDDEESLPPPSTDSDSDDMGPPPDEESGATTAPATVSHVDPVTGVVTQVAAPTPAGGAVEARPGVESAGAPSHGGAVPPPAPAPPTGAPPPPAAPSAAVKAAPPPPVAGKGKAPKAPVKKGKGAKGPQVQWWKGGKPKVPLRVFHWEKIAVSDEKAEGTMWNAVHFKVDCSFDQDDFVDKFQAKKGREKKSTLKEVVKKTEMMDSKKFQNISIMLHKMPEIDDIKKGLDILDEDILSRDCLEALKAQIPTEEEEDMFVSKIDEKMSKNEEWEKPELYYKMIHEYNSAIFRKRAETWLFSLDWNEMVSNIVKPLTKLTTAICSVIDSQSLPYVMGVLLGFGNTMNAGTAKGNAGGFSPKTLTQLEAARDKSGKINLLQHLVHTVKKERYDALGLPVELKSTANNVHQIKYDDLDRAFKDAEDALKKFGTQYKNVVAHIEKSGKGASDPYVTKMMDFKTAADAELAKLQTEYATCKEQFNNVLSMWSAPKKVKDKPQPEEFFGSLVPFLERFKMECDVIQKEDATRAKQHRPGEKVMKNKPSAQIDEVVGDIQQTMVAS